MKEGKQYNEKVEEELKTKKDIRKKEGREFEEKRTLVRTGKRHYVKPKNTNTSLYEAKLRRECQKIIILICNN